MTFLMTTFASGAISNAAVFTSFSDGRFTVQLDAFLFVALVLTAGVALFRLLPALLVARRLRREGWNRRSRRAFLKKRLVGVVGWCAICSVGILVASACRSESEPLYTVTIVRIPSDWVVSNSARNSSGEGVSNAFVQETKETKESSSEVGKSNGTVVEVSNDRAATWRPATDDGEAADSNSTAVRSTVPTTSAEGIQSDSEPSLDDYPRDERVFIPFISAVSATETRPRQETTKISQPVYRDDRSKNSRRTESLRRDFAPTTPLVPYPNVDSNGRSSANSRTPRSASVEQATYVAQPEEPSILVQIDEEYNRVNARVKRSVMAIEARKYSNDATRKLEEETGCGFLFQYKNRLFLITNRHVVADATSRESVKIFLPNKTSVSPLKVTTCPDFDLAVLELNRADLPNDGSVALCYFGDSDELQVANFVGTIGNPFGLRDTVTYGHVSSLRRRNLPLNQTNKNSLQEYVQIDASINPGNSGGPLYNARGEVVGVVTAIATTSGKNEGVAFAIPINLALSVVKAMIDSDGWRRSHLGVELAPATRADFSTSVSPDARGSKIVRVQSDSPADKAGLRQGDVVLEFDGETIEDDVHLARLIATSDASETATLRVLRGGRAFEVKTGLLSGNVAE